MVGQLVCLGGGSVVVMTGVHHVVTCVLYCATICSSLHELHVHICVLKYFLI